MVQRTNFLIVEDELLIAEMISKILENEGCVNIRIVSSVADAIKEIELNAPGMILTDINLGDKKTGIHLGELLHTTYHIPFIYISSHSSSEIIGKAKLTRPNAYIIKPFKKEDLLVAIELALFNTSEKSASEEVPELIVKEGRAMVRIDCRNITWLEADGNYTTINLTDNKRRVVRTSLSDLAEQLPTSGYLRIHKSFVINKKQVSEIKTYSIMIEGNELPIGRSYKLEVENAFK
jgi:two-component system response regulator LytT